MRSSVVIPGMRLSFPGFVISNSNSRNSYETDDLVLDLYRCFLVIKVVASVLLRILIAARLFQAPGKASQNSDKARFFSSRRQGCFFTSVARPRAVTEHLAFIHDAN